MRYRIQANDDDAYQRAESYADDHCREGVKVKLPERRVLSIEGLSDVEIDEFRSLGADVEPEFQWHLEGSPSAGVD